jgi:phosphonate transport system substrate-binding protein
MFWKFSRRFFLTQFLLVGANQCKSLIKPAGELVIGAISYDEGEQTIQQYDRLSHYLGKNLKTHITLEPVRNETTALERIQNRDWSMVFAPPGVAAIAIADHQYTPILPLQGIGDLRSILVIRRDHPIQDIHQLSNQQVALGQPGSAVGYYIPLYNLYGLVLAQILFAPTPDMVLEWVQQGKAIAGAVSLSDLNSKQPENRAKFRVLFTDPHHLPAGVILISSTLDANYQDHIRRLLVEAPMEILQDVGYVPNAPVPDYQYMITVVKRVQKIANRLHEKPVRLF